MSSVRGSTRPSTSRPFTLNFTWVLAMCLFSLRSALGSLESPFQRALHDHPPDGGAILDRAARVGGRRHDRSGGFRGSLERRLLQTATDDRSRGVLGQQRPVGQIGECDGTAGDLAKTNRQNHAGSRSGVVADFALELFVGVAVAGRRNCKLDGGDNLTRLQRGGVDALIEIARLYRTRAVAPCK